MALKNFSNGDVFTGADMDSLVLGGTMRFATPTERTTTMTGDLAVQNGMMSYLASTGKTTRYAGGWMLLPTTPMFAYAAPALTAAYAAVTSATGFNTNLLGSYNYGLWFSASPGRFNPTLAGYYEFVGGFVHDNMTSYQGGFRACGLRFNSASSLVAASVTGFTGQLNASALRQGIHMRPYVQYLNGTTDYVELGMFSGVGVTVNIPYAVTPPEQTYFTGKYLGN